MSTGTEPSRKRKRRLCCARNFHPLSTAFWANCAIGPRPAGHDDLAPYLWFDQRYFLPDDILNKADRMSMAHSLEVRPPFLDHRIVEFAATLPASLKIRGSRQKFLLKELMRDKLPPSVLQRKKVGFDIPAHDWLRGCLRPLMMDVLLDGALRARGTFPARSDRDSIFARHLERRDQCRISLMGPDGAVSVDEKMGDSGQRPPARPAFGYRKKLAPISSRSAGCGGRLPGLHHFSSLPHG